MKRKNKQSAKSLSLLSLVSISIFILTLLAASCSSVKKITHKDVTSTRENNGTVAVFVTYVGENNNMLPDHQYISNALVKMADAVNAMAGEIGYSIALDLAAAKNHAMKITQDPNETTHADNIRKAADILSGALKNMQLTSYESLAIPATDLQSDAEAIRPDMLVHNQKAAVGKFLKDAAALLDKMN